MIHNILKYLKPNPDLMYTHPWMNHKERIKVQQEKLKDVFKLDCKDGEEFLVGLRIRLETWVDSNYFDVGVYSCDTLMFEIYNDINEKIEWGEYGSMWHGRFDERVPDIKYDNGHIPPYLIRNVPYEFYIGKFSVQDPSVPLTQMIHGPPRGVGQRRKKKIKSKSRRSVRPRRRRTRSRRRS